MPPSREDEGMRLKVHDIILQLISGASNIGMFVE
jgi:hypothetical protein